MSHSRSGEERRRFFRIDDRLPLAVHRPSGPDASRAGGRGLAAAGLLAELDRRIVAIVAAARVQAPAVAELAELLNRKLDFVIDALELREDALRRVSFREQEVSISACGIGLDCPEPFEVGEALVVELLLPPEAAHLRVPARVVRCRDEARGAYRLQLDFAGLEPGDQELLIQFIVRRQGQFLQRLREQREAQPARKLSS